MSLKKKIKRLRKLQDVLLDELDEIGHRIKIGHIEYAQLCSVREVLKKLKN